MARKVRVVLNRKAFDRQILHELPAPVLDDVQKQMEGMARIDPAVTVYRNDDRERGNVVAPSPCAVDHAHLVFSLLLGTVLVRRSPGTAPFQDGWSPCSCPCCARSSPMSCSPASDRATIRRANA